MIDFYEVITSSLSYNILFYHKENVKKIEEKRTHINVVQNIAEYIEKSGKEKFLKITVCDESKFIFNSIMKRLKEIWYRRYRYTILLYRNYKQKCQ